MLDYQFKLLEAKIRGVKITELFGAKKELNSDQKELLESQIEKLKSGYPLDYLLGEIQILGLKLKLNENVLIPRPETEEWLFEFSQDFELTKYPCSNTTVILNSFQDPQQSRTNTMLAKHHVKTSFCHPSRGEFSGSIEVSKNHRHPELVSGSPTIESHSPNKTNQNLLIDLGCGCGIIGLYLAKFYNKVFSVDISPKALEVAKENAESNNVENIKFFLSDGLSNPEIKIGIEKFNNWTLTANLPYLPQKDKLDEDEHKVKYEPNLALYSGDDGLDLFRKVLNDLESFETMPNQVIFELDPRNINIAKGLLDKLKYKTNIWVDYGNFKRVLIGNFYESSSQT